MVDPKNGKVIGVKAISSSSSSTDDGDNIYSDNVIIATGGFANDRTNTSLEKYRPDLVQFATTNGKFATGDGHKMAMRAWEYGGYGKCTSTSYCFIDLFQMHLEKHYVLNC